MSEYNGWSNYETWRINLEMIDGMTPEDFGFRPNDFQEDDENGSGIKTIASGIQAERLAAALEDHVVELIEMDTNGKGFAHDLAMSFIAKVDWDEIAEHLILDYAEV
jgi:hypothetical protein